MNNPIFSIRRLCDIYGNLERLIEARGGFGHAVLHGLHVLNRGGLVGLRRAWTSSRIHGTVQTIDADGAIVDRNDYAEWVRRYDCPDEAQRARLQADVECMTDAARISIVLVVSDAVSDWLRETIESIRGQLYGNWDLSIVNSGTITAATAEMLVNSAASDTRIRSDIRTVARSRVAALNAAVAMGQGEWVVLVEQHDLLSPEALYRLIEATRDVPDAALIYADQDTYETDLGRSQPYFKPAWNPDLFLSTDIIGPMGAYRAELLQEVGGFRDGSEGAESYDLSLRCVGILQARQIIHIPRILYHQRAAKLPDDVFSSRKSMAMTAALDAHFQRLGILARSEPIDGRTQRVRYCLPLDRPMVSLIIPTRNGLVLLRQCVDSILKTTRYENYEIIIVDNNSDDPAVLDYFSLIENGDTIRILKDARPFNYSALNNHAVAEARGDYIGLINNDIEVISPGWLEEMLSLAAQPGVGAVGARLWYPDDTLQHGGVIIGLAGVAGHAHKDLPREETGYFGRAAMTQTLSAVTAACLIVRKSVYQEVNGLDEDNLAVAFNDVDFCLRLCAAGYRNIWTPYAELYHHESATRGTDHTVEKRARFLREVHYMKTRWATDSVADFAYSPNLTLRHEDFSLAWPPRIGVR